MALLAKTKKALIEFQAGLGDDWNCIVLKSNDDTIRLEVFTDGNGDIGEVLCCGVKNVAQDFYKAVDSCKSSNKQFFNLLFDELEKIK